MKIINKSSVLKNLPKGLSKSEYIIFDAIRFSFEIIDNSFENLIKDLLKITNNKENNNIYGTFNFAWSIIDNAIRLSNTCKLLPWENVNDITGHIEYLKNFRNTFQHLDERIEESLISTETPFYGVISWINKPSNSEKIEILNLVSGNLIHGPNAIKTVPDREKIKSQISHIELHTVNRKSKQIKTDLTEIIENLKKLNLILENTILDFCKTQNIQLLNWEGRQDMIIRIKEE